MAARTEHAAAPRPVSRLRCGRRFDDRRGVGYVRAEWNPLPLSQSRLAGFAPLCDTWYQSTAGGDCDSAAAELSATAGLTAKVISVSQMQGVASQADRSSDVARDRRHIRRREPSRLARRSQASPSSTRTEAVISAA